PGLGAPDSGIPPALERVLRHCLEKNLAERFRSAQDLAFALEALIGAPSGSTASGAAVVVAFHARGRRWLAAALVPALVAAGFVLGRAFKGTARSASAPRLVSF